MQYIIGLAIVAVLGYLLYRSLGAGATGCTVPGTASDRGFAFLANGLLFHREPGGPVRELQSAYVQESLERRERSRERHAWKQGTSFGVAAGGGLRSFEAADKPIRATGAVFEANGDLLYFLKDEGLGGLFRREAASGKELRVLLQPNLHLEDLNPSPDGERVAASSQQSAGAANIVLLNRDGSALREITGGDTVDAAPAWIPGAPDRLLFQSAGLARNDQGHILALGPSSIQMLDMSSGSVVPILEHPDQDYLKPRVCPAGNLLFIRRPYKAPHYGPAMLLGDTLLFPFRLLRALFHYLNFFSLMYSRKPLTSANGPVVKADLKNILVQGRRIDAEKALRSERPVQGVPSLVPGDWELVSRAHDGSERVLAANVASYDLGPDGTVVYSNGRGVFVLDREGNVGLALRDEFIGEVVAGAA
jgi:hypothetical protein